MISEGHCTYGEIKAVFPHIPELTWRCSGKSQYPVHDLVICHRSGNRDAPLEDNERFELTADGKNVLYRLQKEAKAASMTQKSIDASVDAANWAKIAVAVAIILYIIDVLRSR